ncbi:transcriptional regulatory protein [Chitinispirillum alkaliphilum]|nr:transcriptional regulatory protein [Chitinispirillum alkaliphilum]
MKQNLSRKNYNGRIKLLIVEDEKELLHSIAFILKRQEYKVATSLNAENALDMLGKNKESSFDLIITDIQLPGMSGLEFIDTLRKQGPAVPTMVITAYKGEEILDALAKRDIVHFLIKPFDTSELIAKVKSALSKEKDR